MTDDDLVLSYARGETAALEKLIELHWPSAYRLALRSLGDPASAEDTAQEVFIRLAQAAPRYRSGTFAPWFRTLVLNAVRNHVRSAARRRRYEDEVAAARSREAATPDAERRLLAEEVQAHVRRLPLDVRFAVLLHFYEGRPHEEVAEVLGCPKGTASSRIRRGLEQLRESLAGAGFAAAAGNLEPLLAAARDFDAAPPPPPATASIEAAAAKAASASAGKLVAAAAAVLLVGAVAWFVAGSRPPAPGSTGGEAPRVAQAPAPVDATPSPALAAPERVALAPPAPIAAPGPDAAKNSSVSRKSLPDDTLTNKSAFGAAFDGRKVELEAGPATEAPKGHGRIVGLVTDPEGRPVPGVRITAMPGGKGGMFMFAAPGGGPMGGARTRASATIATAPLGGTSSRAVPPPGRGGMVMGGSGATTGPDGTYAIDGLAGGLTTVMVDAPRHVNPQPQPIDVPAEGEVRHDVRLERGDEYTGRVVDPSGAPIEGIEVSVIGENDAAEPGATGPKVVGGAVGGKAVALARTVWAQDRSGVSGPDGKFTIAGFKGARLRDATARDPSNRYAMWRGRFSEGMTITLEPNATIHGRVVAKGDGKPIGGAEVACGERRMTVDSAGRFTLDGIAPGARRVTASHDDFAPTIVEVDASSGVASEVTIELGQGATIAARVLSAKDGRVLEGAIVHLEGTEPLDDLIAAATLEIHHVPVGRVRLVASAPDHVEAKVDVTIPAEGATVPVDIRLEPGATIEGTLRMAAGASLEEARLMVMSPANAYMNDLSPAADGTWRAGGLRAGTYTVRVMAGGPIMPGAGTKTITLASGETARCDIDLERPTGATIRGSVRARTGPMPDGPVLLVRVGGGDLRAAKIGADGNYSIPGVDTGLYDLSLEGVRRRVEVPASARGEVVVDIELPRLAVAGRVVDSEGAAIAGARVVASPAGAEGTGRMGQIGAMEALTDATGAFRIEGLDEASYTVRASRAGFGEAQSDPVRAGGTPVTITLLRGGRVRARVSGPDGQLAEMALFYLVDRSGATVGAGDRPFPIGRGGELVAEDVPPGTYTAIAGIPNGSFDRRTGVQFDGTEMTLDLAVGPGGAIEVAARDGRTGAVLAGARVELTFADGAPLPMSITQMSGPGDAVKIGISGNAPVQTASDGVARRERLGPGAYRVRVIVEGGREAVAQATVADDQITRVEIAVP